MRVTKFEIVKVPPSWVWLLIHTDTEHVGLGEPFLEGHPEAVIAEVNRLEPLLVGEDPRQVERHWTRMYEGGSGYRGGPVTMSAISGIDMALWDLKGKAAGLPIHELLGGRTRDRVLMYHAAGSDRLRGVVEPGGRIEPGDTVGHGEATLDLISEWGYRAVKVHLQPGPSLTAVRDIDSLVDVVARIRASIGDDVLMAVDLHNPHPTVGAQLAHALQPFRPLFIEEPVPPEAVEALSTVAAHTRAPLAAGERWMGKDVFARALALGALSVVQPDLAHAGGITECKKIAALAEAAQVDVALHTPLSPLALAASIQLDATIPNFLIQEHNEVLVERIDGRTVIGGGYLQDPFVLDDDGCVAVPDGPGLGIEIDRDGLDAIMARPWSNDRA